MNSEVSEATRLLRRAVLGDQQAWGALLAQSRDRLRRMVALRLDRRLQGRVDPSDIIQETYIDASARLADYARQPDMPFFLWLRFLTGQRLLRANRQHLGAEIRDVAREVSLYRGALFFPAKRTHLEKRCHDLQPPSERVASPVCADRTPGGAAAWRAIRAGG